MLKHEEQLSAYPRQVRGANKGRRTDWPFVPGLWVPASAGTTTRMWVTLLWRMM